MKLTAEEIEAQLALLSTYRQRLSSHLHQQAIFGSARLPYDIRHGIGEARERIASIKQILRMAGHAVADHPDDDEPPRRTAGSQAAQPSRQSPLARPIQASPASAAPPRRWPRLSWNEIGVITAILALLLALVSFARDVTGVEIHPGLTASPASTAPPTAPPTASPFVLPIYDLTQTSAYTDPDQLFHAQIPDGWDLKRRVRATDSASVVTADFAPRAGFDIFWHITVELIDDARIGSPALEAFGPFAKSYISNTYGNFPNLQIADPVYSPTRNMIRIDWSFTSELPDGRTIRMSAITEIQRQGAYLVAFTLYVPDDQFRLQDVEALRDSIVIQ